MFKKYLIMILLFAIIFTQQELKYPINILSLYIDTDGGRDYYTKAITTGFSNGYLVTYSDYCISGNRIVEYFCFRNQVKKYI